MYNPFVYKKLDVMNKDFGFPTMAFVEICYHLKNE